MSRHAIWARAQASQLSPTPVGRPGKRSHDATPNRSRWPGNASGCDRCRGKRDSRCLRRRRYRRCASSARLQASGSSPLPHLTVWESPLCPKRAAAGSFACPSRSSVKAKAERSNSRHRTARPSGRSVMARILKTTLPRFGDQGDECDRRTEGVGNSRFGTGLKTQRVCALVAFCTGKYAKKSRRGGFWGLLNSLHKRAKCI